MHEFDEEDEDMMRLNRLREEYFKTAVDAMLTTGPHDPATRRRLAELLDEIAGVHEDLAAQHRQIAETWRA